MNTHKTTASQPNILIADDNLQNLKILTDILTRNGYSVIKASDGPTALMLSRNTPMELILLDIRMPEMDGYEVCNRLKSDAKTQNIPVIFLSALEDMNQKVRAFSVGGVDYITKPFQAEEVLARIRTHLSLRNLQQHLEKRVDERTAELSTALERQAILLREVHHRTRNNMSVMCGLINFHARQINDETVRSKFKDLSSRINAMAIVHQQLHQPDLTIVNLKEYILRLTKSLLVDYHSNPELITCTYDLAPESLPVDSAVPFGLLLHELICNAIKHAFPDNRCGEIKIILKVSDDGHKDLWVKDNGVGLPPDFDMKKNATLGFELVRLLTKDQLQGTLTFEHAEVGTSVHVCFKEAHYPKRI